MAENIKPKKKIKVKLKPGQEMPTPPAGYSLKTDKPGKKVFELIEKYNIEGGAGREATPEERKSMIAGTFYGPNEAQYGGDASKTEKKQFIVKTKEKKFKDSGPSFTGKEKREGRKAEREACKVGRKFASGCAVGKGRISRARY